MTAVPGPTLPNCQINVTKCSAYTVYLLIYYIKLKNRLSVCLSAFFVGVDLRWLYGLTLNLLDVIAMSSGTTKFIFKSF